MVGGLVFGTKVGHIFFFVLLSALIILAVVSQRRPALSGIGFYALTDRRAILGFPLAPRAVTRCAAFAPER